MSFHRQVALILGMIRSGELQVGISGNRWKSLTLKPLGKTVDRLKYEIDQHGMRPTTACQMSSWSSWAYSVGAAGRHGAYCSSLEGARLLPADLPLKTVSGGRACRDVIAPSGLRESSKPADGVAAWSHPQALIGGRDSLRVRHPT